MGCSRVDDECQEIEKPGREVELSAFGIERTEVTITQYRACVEDGACKIPETDGSSYNWGKPERALHPVNGIDWSDALTFCKWVGRRLPTEAEWEKAARGTSGGVYPWGQAQPTCDRVVMNEGAMGCGKGTTAPVGTKPTGESPYGVLDMSGNVAEWTADWYSATAYSTGRTTNPTGPASGTARVARGGSFANAPTLLRAGVRAGGPPGIRAGGLGFRCAL